MNTYLQSYRTSLTPKPKRRFTATNKEDGRQMWVTGQSNWQYLKTNIDIITNPMTKSNRKLLRRCPKFRRSERSWINYSLHDQSFSIIFSFFSLTVKTSDTGKSKTGGEERPSNTKRNGLNIPLKSDRANPLRPFWLASLQYRRKNWRRLWRQHHPRHSSKTLYCGWYPCASLCTLAYPCDIPNFLAFSIAFIASYFILQSIQRLTSEIPCRKAKTQNDEHAGE